MVCNRTCIALALSCALALPLAAQTPPAADSKPLVRTTTNEVVLDIVVRDKHGRTVRDLEQKDVQVTDGGAKQNITSFRLVERKVNGAATEGAPAAGTGATGATPAPAFDPLRQIRLVSFVFERLGVDGRRLSRQAALDFLKNETGPGVYFAVFSIDQRLSPLVPFTPDHEAVRKAIEKATSGSYSQFASEADGIRKALEQTSGNEDYVSQIANSSGGRSGVSVNGGAEANAKMAEMMRNMLQFDDSMAREQQSRSSIFSLMAIVREQYRLPGRKTVLYFSEGLHVTPEQDENLKTVISYANRANVSVYAIDARGLLSSRMNQGGSDMMSGVLRSSITQSQQAQNHSATTPDQVKIFDTAEGSLRANTQNSLANLAESTGGFLIANTNEFKTPLRRITEDIDTYYELTYTPAIERYDGTFRKVSVHLDRSDLKLQARNGYFALPSSVGGVQFPYEMPLLQALDTKPMPRNIEFHAGALRFQQTPEGVNSEVVLEVPLKGITFVQDKEKQQYRTHFSVLALLKNSNGEVIQKFSKDVPFEGPLDKMGGFQEGNFIYNNHFRVPPGRYTLDAAVMDREGEKVGARRMSFVVPTAPGLNVSSIAFVRRVTPSTEAPDAADPLQVQGGKITPTLTSSVHGGKGAAMSTFFAVYPNPKVTEKPQLSLEFYQEGKLIGRGAPELPAAGPDGRIPYVATTPLDSFAPGMYEMRVVVKQGTEQVAERTVFQVE